MQTLCHGIRCWIGALAWMSAIYTASASERLVTLAGINVTPIVNTICAEAPSRTDVDRLENLRSSFLKKLQDMQLDVARTKQDLTNKEQMITSLDAAAARSIHELNSVEATLKVDLLDDQTKNRLRLASQTLNTRFQNDVRGLVEAKNNLEKSFEEAVEAETRASFRPAYLKAIDCVEKRLAILRQAPAPAAVSSPFPIPSRMPRFAPSERPHCRAI